VASISKQFTAATIVMLAQEGKLSLDDEVRKYIPELPDFGPPVTIRHLIHHTSGLRDQWSLLSLAGWRYSLDLITDDDVLTVISREKDLNFRPGERHLYCNTGYTLLGQIVKRVSGQSLREFTTKRLFGPLGMSSTHFRDDHAEVVKNMAYGYVRDKGTGAFRLSLTNFDTVGATSLLTTVEDLALWDEAFYTPRMLGKKLFEQMLERGKLNDGKQLDYAFGLMHGTYRGLRTVDHAGADAGYRADLLRFPEQHFSVACLCNLAETNPSQLTRRVADIYLAKQVTQADSEKRPEEPFVSLSEPQLAKYAGLYWSAQEQEAVRIESKPDSLIAVVLPNERYELRPVAENRFQAVGAAARFEFAPTPTGAMTLKRGSRVYAPAPEFRPSAAQLTEFAGVYRSDEIEPVYRIVVQDGGLTLTRLKSRPDKLRPLIADYFAGEIGGIQFVRGAGDRVSGFVLNEGRITNFRFRKTAE
jgi:CubicO group peptidase (beta-lactamase class C family)